jgi:hypothetical protein
MTSRLTATEVPPLPGGEHIEYRRILMYKSITKGTVGSQGPLYIVLYLLFRLLEPAVL